MGKIKRSLLVSAAEELNEVLGLEPAIDTEKAASQLETKIKEAASLIDPDEDVLKDETWDVLESLDAAQRPNADDGEEEEADTDDGEEEEEAPEVEDEDDTDDGEEEEEAPAPKKSKKPAPKKKDTPAPPKKSKKPAPKDEDDGDDDEAPAPAPKKPKKKEKDPAQAGKPGVFAAAVKAICQNPDQTLEALNKAMAKKGYEPNRGNSSAIRMAYGSVTKVINVMKENGWVQQKKKGK